MENKYGSEGAAMCETAGGPVSEKTPCCGEVMACKELGPCLAQYTAKAMAADLPYAIDKMAAQQQVEAAIAKSAGNGVQRDFGTGATRSSSEGKIDYEGHISPRVLRLYGEYMHEHRVQRDGKVRGSDNWQEGIPVHNYAKSLIRHVQEFHLMWRGEDVINVDNGRPFTFKQVLCAVLFNTMGLLFELSRVDVTTLNRTRMVKEERQAIEKGKPVVHTERVSLSANAPDHEIRNYAKTVGVKIESEPDNGTWRVIAERERY